MGKVDYFDKAVTVMSNFVLNPVYHNPTYDLGTDTVMTFVGQCSLDHYYKLDFDTKKFVVGDMPTVVAFSSTLTYIYHYTFLNTVGNTKVNVQAVMYRVHFDPDTANCGTGAYKTPPVIKVWEMAPPAWPFRPEDNGSWIRAGIFRRDLGAIMFLGDFSKLTSTRTLSRSPGILHGVKLSTIDTYMDANEDVRLDRFDTKSRRMQVTNSHTAFTVSTSFLNNWMWYPPTLGASHGSLATPTVR